MKYLFLSPHPDDIELCCGGTIHRLATEGHEIAVAVFSDCDTLGIDGSINNAHEALSVGATFYYYYPQRHFPEHRQDILESILSLRNRTEPDVVFIPDPESDIHQDHQVIGEEAMRAFKMTADIVGYSHAHNQFISRNNYFVAVNQDDVTAKLKSISFYKSESGRYYTNPDAMCGVLRHYGVQCESEYAEAFRVIRQVDRLK